MNPKFIPYSKKSLNAKDLLIESTKLHQFMESRRSVRDFSTEPIALEVIENLIMTASTAPSGANKQPWVFCVVTNPLLKTQIRQAAEKEEFESYNGRMTPEWLEDLAPLGTDWRKPFLEDAPALIIVLKKNHTI